jgi:hypothetical protein
MSSEETKVAVMQEQIIYIKKQVDTIVDKLDNNYVTKDELGHLESRVVNVEEIIRKIVWIIVTAFLTALLGSVIIYYK